ncbi:MAG: type II secretion system protein GspJ [Myxococcota bacterium]
MIEQGRQQSKQLLVGFTLIETLVAVVLLGMLGVMGMTTLQQMISAKERVTARSQPHDMIRQAMQRMTQEIATAYVSAHRDEENPVVETQFKGETDKLSFTAFGHTVRRQGEKRSDQVKLTYSLGTDPRTGAQALLRAQVVDASAFGQEEGKPQVLCRNVESLAFSYWDDQLRDWQSAWDSQSTLTGNALPARVRIEMVARTHGDTTLKLSTQTRIRLTEPIHIQ